MFGYSNALFKTFAFLSCVSAAVGKNKRLSKKGKGSKKKMYVACTVGFMRTDWQDIADAAVVIIYHHRHLA